MASRPTSKTRKDDIGSTPTTSCSQFDIPRFLFRSESKAGEVYGRAGNGVAASSKPDGARGLVGAKTRHRQGTVNITGHRFGPRVQDCFLFKEGYSIV